MSPERLEQVEKLFHAALELPPDERESFLLENCAGDPELRREIESFLSFEENYDGLIDAPPARLAAEMFADREKTNLSGRKINQYKIISLLGEGGMGAVYLARDTILERKVALKLLSAQVAGDGIRLNRFFQEAKAASALNHPNIITVHEIGRTGDAHFIVTEFIDGATLGAFLKKEPPPLEKILEIAAQIASALAAAHDAGIIHRDIKPDNVMVRRDGIVKILDFGIAKLSDEHQSVEIDPEAPTMARTLTQPGMIIGTPQYMSPEQARGQQIDVRSDIFSFGVVLYEMLAGRAPFDGATHMDIIGSILKDEPVPLGELVPKISYDLEHLVAKTLRKDREQRYQDIKDVLIDLSDAKRTLEFHIRQIHRTDPRLARSTVEEDSSLARRPRFSFLHVSLLLLAMAVLTGAAFWWLALPRGSAPLTAADLKTVEVANWSSSPGEIYSVGTFSPDAKMVAFTSTRGGRKNIWVKQTAAGEAVQITRDEFENKNPVWSPSGEELAFFSTKGNQAGLWRIPVLGGSPAFVAEITDASSQLKAWSKQNLIYYESKNEIFTADAATGAISKQTDLAAKGIKAGSLSLAPDGKQLAYTTVEDKTWRLWTADLTGTAPKMLVSGPNQIKNLVWHADGRRIFFSASVDGIFQIFVTDTGGAAPQQMTFSENDNLALDVSADGSRILYGSAKEESDVWAVNVKEAREFSVAANLDSELWADVAPDGKTIVYQSIKNLSQGNKIFNGAIYRKTPGAEQEAVSLVSDGYLPLWSPNGQKIAFMRVVGKQHQIETVQSGGGGQKVLTTGEISTVVYGVLPYNRFQAAYFSWSPDSSRIAYVSDRSGHSNIWLVNADGTNDQPLTDNTDANLSLQCPLWSADGKKIAFTAKTNVPQGRTIYSARLIETETKNSRLLTRQERFLRLVGWTGTDRLLVAAIEGSSISVLATEVILSGLGTETGQMKEITRLKDAYLYNIHLSPDARQIAFAAHREGRDNVWLLAADGGEAKKLTGNNDSRLYFSTLDWSPDNQTIFFGKQSRYSLLSMLTNFK